jgi:hypothetical protein
MWMFIGDVADSSVTIVGAITAGDGSGSPNETIRWPTPFSPMEASAQAHRASAAGDFECRFIKKLANTGKWSEPMSGPRRIQCRSRLASDRI